MKEIKDFMNSKENEDNEIKKQENIEDNKDYNKDIFNEINKDIQSDEENINKHFNIFDTDNKFNDIFLGEHKSNDRNNNQKDSNNSKEDSNNREISRFYNINNNEIFDNLKEINIINKINEAKIKNMLMIQQQKKQQEQQKTKLQY